MNKKTLILHIGQSKTGTSSIQRFCQLHRQDLAEEGILYPSVKKGGVDVNLLEHNSFAETLCGISRYPYVPYDGACRQFDQQFMNFSGDRMLLSAESFWGPPHIWSLDRAEDFLPLYRDKLVKLKDWTSQYRLEIILYLRHPLDWFRSSVSHIIRHEGLFGKKVYQSDGQLYELLKPHMDYLSLIDLWQSILQPHRFSIKAFDRKQMYGGDAVSDFCHQIGYTGRRTKELEENSSWPAEITILKRKFNETPHPKWQEWAAIDVLSSIAQNYPLLSAYQIPEPLQRCILSETEAMCNELGRRYDVGFGRVDVTPPRDIRPDVLEDVESRFKATYSSWPVQLMVMNHFMKGFMRNNVTVVYNYIKFIVKLRFGVALLK